MRVMVLVKATVDSEEGNDTVIEQSPKGGSDKKAKRGSSVTITVGQYTAPAQTQTTPGQTTTTPGQTTTTPAQTTTTATTPGAR